MALIGSINEQGELQGQINGARYLTGVITNASAVGGEIVGMRGLKGDKGDKGDTGATGADGQDGADGFSPSASVSKVGDTTTITITDKDGTTTASVYDGKDAVFIAEYGVTTYDEIHSALLNDKMVVCHRRHNDTHEYYSIYQQDSASFPEVYTFVSAMGKPVGSSTRVSVWVVTCDSTDEWSRTEYLAQVPLVSGTNIKTINNESLLGSGNIDIQSGGASAFVAEYGVTSYSDVKDAYDEDAIIICTVDDNGNTAILQLAYFDDANDMFYFAQPYDEGWHWASIAIDDTWDDGSFYFANTDTATQLRDGLMSALDWQKLDGIASGAEVNVQSDWNEADSTDDAYIKNKPTLPTDFTGATSSSAGVHGLVPAPNSGGQNKILSADGNWYNVVISEYLDLDNNDQGLRISLKDDSNATKHRYNFSFKSGINILKASTSDYGFAKLSSSIASTSEALAATPSAVKEAYDLAADATATPTASKKSKFDSDAHMNSTDMTTGADSELEDFIDGLNVLGGGIDVNSTDKYIIIGDIGICWGRSTTGSNSACSPSLPLTYADTSKMYVYATSVYSGSNTYVSVTVSSQIASTSSLNLYARCGTSTTGANYGIQWLVIGEL